MPDTLLKDNSGDFQHARNLDLRFVINSKQWHVYSVLF